MLGLTKSGGPLKSVAVAEPRVRVKEKASGKVGTLPQSQVEAAIKAGKFEKL